MVDLRAVRVEYSGLEPKITIFFERAANIKLWLIYLIHMADS